MGDLIRRNICPNCGGTNLELDCLYQYGIIYKINKDGKVSKKYRKQDYGTMDCAYIHCCDCGWGSPDADCGNDSEGYLLMDKDWFEED